MGIVNDILDWAADKVQTATGEKERRQLVQKLKDTYSDVREKVTEMVDVLNTHIGEFNQKICRLNILRKYSVELNINKLYVFLAKFGNIKAVGEYVAEAEKVQASLPEQQFEKTSNYIQDVDWSKDDVFLSTFFLSPLGMKMKTRKQNLSLIESINELILESEEMMNQLKMKVFTIEIDKQVCDLYMECIDFITQYINDIILPELELIEAFFQANKIKNEILVDRELEALGFKNDIEVLHDTIYANHYLFVKNTFMFYVMSCKIYHTPVLTHLLNNQSSEADIGLLEKQKSILIEQGKQVTKCLLINR